MKKQADFTPTHTGVTIGPETNAYQAMDGHYISRDGVVIVRATIAFGPISIQAMREFNAAAEQAARALAETARTLSHLRYPPKAPARGSVSRRREKLKKAGVRR